MIDASELRLGNLLSHSGEIVKVLGIEEGMIRYWSDGLELVYTNSEFFDPVPLTEEWLLKLGFENDKYQGDLVLNCIVYYRKMRDYGTTGKESHFWIASLGDDEYYDCPVNIKYVHQLQNLYFALTDNELPIKD